MPDKKADKRTFLLMSVSGLAESFANQGTVKFRQPRLPGAYSESLAALRAARSPDRSLHPGYPD